MLIYDVYQIDSVIDIYISFFIFVSIVVYHRINLRGPSAIQKDLVVYLYFI